MPNHPIRPHHQKTIAKLVDRYRSDPEIVAVIIGGSVAKGRARDDSDVDFHLVVTLEEWERRAGIGELFVYATDVADYPGGYVDGKVVSRRFFEDVAEKGSEPARAAFEDAFLVLNRDPGLPSLLEKIVAYPEEQRDRNMADFYSQVLLYADFFLREAEKRQDRYLMAHSASELALFSCRLLLAYNRKLYPYHKWLQWSVARLEHKPEGFDAALAAFLDFPSYAGGQALAGTLREFGIWTMDMREAVQRFAQLREWNWMEHEAPVHDR